MAGDAVTDAAIDAATAERGAEPGKKRTAEPGKKRKRISSAQKELAYFFVLDAGLRVTTAAAFMGIKYDALTQSVRREKKRRALDPVVRSPEEAAHIQERVEGMWAALQSEQKRVKARQGSSTTAREGVKE